MRRGELLNLQWRDVNLDRKEITVRAETTKTRTGRILPVSSRLAAVLEMARTSVLAFLKTTEPPDGRSEDETAALLARCYVFGDGAGLNPERQARRGQWPFSRRTATSQSGAQRTDSRQRLEPRST